MKARRSVEPRGRVRLDDPAQMRVLANPLRLRVLQALAEQPATTKQVALRLGCPPTRLYHHVHALERAGLVRLRETRPKRGTTEHYYEAVARGFEFGRGFLGRAMSDSTRKRATRRGPNSLAGRETHMEQTPPRADLSDAVRAAQAVLDVARQDFRALRRQHSRSEPGLQPLAARAVISATPERIRALSAELMRLLGRLERERPVAAQSRLRYALTLAFVPEGAGSKRRRTR